MKLSNRGVVFLWLLFVAAAIILISRTHFNADLSAFLPRMPTPAQQILVDQLRDGVVSRLILIGIEGDKPEALSKINRALATELRKQKQFPAINNGEESGLEKDRDFLWRHRYLLSPAISADHFSVSALRQSLEDDMQLLGSSAGMLVRRILPNDPTGELLRIIEQFEGQSKPAMQDGVWFSKDGKRSLLVAQTHATGSDIDAQAEALQVIHTVFNQVNDGGVAKLLSTGPGVFAVTSRAMVENDASRVSLIATVLIAVILLALYRSPRVLMLSLLPVATGVLAGITAVSIGFGSVHGITLGFGVTLIGECVDYAIYLFTQIGPGSAPRVAFQRIWPTLRLGVLTSICGFSALLFSGFTGLAQLGLFSIAGLIAAVAVVRWLLPALLPDQFSVQIPVALASLVNISVKRASILRLPLLLVLIIASSYLFLQRNSIWSGDLASLSPVPKKEQQLDESLRRDIGAPDIRHLIIINASNKEAALQASEKVTVTLQGSIRQGFLQGVDSPANYLPSEKMQRSRQAAIPHPAVLQENLQKAGEGMPFRTGLFTPFLNDANTAKTQPLIDRASLQNTRLALKLDSLLIQRGDTWTAMLPLRGVSNAEAIAKQIGSTPEIVLLDLKYESDQLYKTYRQEAVNYALFGILMIAILLWINLRSLRRVFVVLAPLSAAVIITAALLVQCSMHLSMFHLIGLLLTVAIGSNYALFFEGSSDQEHTRERTLISLLFANLAAIIGFGLLSFSEVAVLNAIGTTVGIGTILSLVCSAILINSSTSCDASFADLKEMK